MKKIGIILLTLALLISLAACGSTPEAESTPEDVVIGFFNAQRDNDFQRAMSYIAHEEIINDLLTLGQFSREDFMGWHAFLDGTTFSIAHSTELPSQRKANDLMMFREIVDEWGSSDEHTDNIMYRALADILAAHTTDVSSIYEVSIKFTNVYGDFEEGPFFVVFMNGRWYFDWLYSAILEPFFQESSNTPEGRITIPDFIGQRYIDLIDHADFINLFTFDAAFESNNEVPQGVVISQDPGRGREVMPLDGEQINIRLVVSSGD